MSVEEKYYRQTCSFGIKINQPLKYFQEAFKRYNGFHPRSKTEINIWIAKLVEDKLKENTDVR